MSYDRKVFFDRVRKAPYGGRLSAVAIKGLEAILSEAETRDDVELNELAYILATVFREVGPNMQPIRELGRGKGKKYGKPDPVTKQTYFGRGLVQLTWKANYQKAARALGVDLVGKPDLALDPAVSVQILFEGMREGWFTGKKLHDYFNDHGEDPAGARRIVNGTDHAELIADYYRAFKAALEAADVATPLPDDVEVDAESPDGKPIAKSKSFAGGILGGLATLIAAVPTLLQAVDSPLSLATLAVAGALALGAGYLVIQSRIDVRALAGV